MAKQSEATKKAKARKYWRRYFDENKDRIRARRRELWSKRSESLKEQDYKRTREWKISWRQKTKIKALTYYGNGELTCVICGFSDIRALTIDHIEGNGADERRAMLKPYPARNFYSWLIKQGYPKGYQTLCMNCQWIKRFEKKEWKV